MYSIVAEMASSLKQNFEIMEFVVSKTAGTIAWSTTETDAVATLLLPSLFSSYAIEHWAAFLDENFEKLHIVGDAPPFYPPAVKNESGKAVDWCFDGEKLETIADLRSKLRLSDLDFSLGAYRQDSGHLRVADPRARPLNPASVFKAESGVWHSSVLLGTSPDNIYEHQQLRVRHELISANVFADMSSFVEANLHIDVVSGQAGFFDEEAFRGQITANYAEPPESADDIAPGLKAGVVGELGVISKTEQYSGSYPVRILCNDAGFVMAAVLNLTR